MFKFKENKCEIISSLIFSFFTILGFYYTNIVSNNMSITRGVIFLCSIIAYFVCTLFYYEFLFLLKYVWRKYNLARTETRNKIEQLFFSEAPFLMPFLFLLLTSIPIMIYFFPGTMHWDAHTQLWEYLGVRTWSAHHPVAVTWLMGKCLTLGRNLCGSDEIGLFFYTGVQYVFQWLIMAYSISVISKLKVPIVLRWCSVIYFAFLPIFRIWGYTLVKDTGYYLSFLLFISAFVNVFIQENTEQRKFFESLRQLILIVVGTIGIVLTRKEGKYIVLLTLLFGVMLNRKYWKIYLVCIFCAIMCIIGVERVWIPSWNIESGKIKEMLSIPMQQTARYLVMYGDDITDEEQIVLQEIFDGNLKDVTEVYNPEVSDPVKELFTDFPSDELLRRYFDVWYAQFKRHPDAYIHGAINHCYGYFYVWRESFWGRAGNYYLGNSDHWEDGHLNIKFGDLTESGRTFYEAVSNKWMSLPILRLLYRAGFYTYVVILECIQLLLKKKKQEMFILAPLILTILVCMVSPVNAYIRYMLPIMAALPISLSWVYYVSEKSKCS